MANKKQEKRLKRNPHRCIRCGVSKKSEKYISWGCGDEYCDTDTLLDWGYF